MDELHKQATKAAFSTSTNASSASGAAVGGGGEALKPPTKPLSGVPGFFSALGRVIRRDLGIDGK